MAQTADFFVTAGDTKTIAVNVIEKDDQSATTITAATIAWKVAQSQWSPVLISKDNDAVGGISITNGVGGTFTITLDSVDTASLKGDYYHECQITFADSEVATVLKGKMTVSPGLV